MNTRKLHIFTFVMLITLVIQTNASQAITGQANDTIHYPKSGWRRDARILSLGVGIVNVDPGRMAKLESTGSYTSSAFSSSTPVYLKLEFYSSRRFGVGMAFNYNTFQFNYSYYQNQNNSKLLNTNVVNYSFFVFNIRVNYHFLYRKALDVYIGGASGLRIGGGSSSVTNLPDLYPSGFLKEQEITLGARYLFKGTIGFYAELGFSRSIAQIGLSYNFTRW